MAGDLYEPHLSLTWGGSLYGSEIFQMGLRLAAPALVLPGARDDWCATNLDDCKTSIASWWGRATSGISPHAVLEWVKLNAIGADGKYENTSVTHQAAVTPNVTPPGFASVTTQHLPPQVALVLSMRTANRGPREAFGHIYLPPAGLDFLYTGPFIKQEHCDTVLASFKTLIDELNDWPGVDPPGAPYVCIASKASSYVSKRTGAVHNYAPSLTKVTGLWVGNVFDTHRSRAKALRQTYSKADVA